ENGMLRRSLLGLSILTWLCLPGLAGAKNSVVGIKTSSSPAPVKTGKGSVQGFKVAQPAAEPAPIKVAKNSVVGTKPASNGSKSSSNGNGSYEDNVPGGAQPEVKTGSPVGGKEEVKTVGYSKGFFVQSQDGKYRLNINGYAQFQTSYDRVGGENTFGFQIRNVRLSFSGNIATKKLTYKLQMDLAKFKDELLLDAWTQYRFNNNVEIRVGQQDIPWQRQSIISSSNQEFVDRSIATTEFLNAQAQDTDKDGVPDKLVRNGRDIGVVVQGTPFNKKLEYNVGFFNGSGTNTANFNNSLLYTGRAVWNIRGDAGYEEGDFANTQKVAAYFGASGNYNTRDLSDDKVTQFGTEAGLKYKGLALQGEFYYRNINPGDSSLASTNDTGYYAQAGYFVIPKHLETAVRASQIFMEGLQNDKAEFEAVVNYYALGQHIKLQGDYAVLPNNTKTGIETSQRFRLKLQTKF
ncbi:MAG TPA: porin, partial [bacterium]|nr:porin [bacterium]